MGTETVERRQSLLEGLARGERAYREGRVLTHAQAKQLLARWLAEPGAPSPAIKDREPERRLRRSNLKR